MSNLQIYGWKQKKRTLLRKILPGDIFCFQYLDDSFVFGRVMTANDLGHVAEIFLPVLNDPEICSLDGFVRLGEPLILDSYGLFDRKIKGDWRIIAHQEDYTAPENESVRFAYGAPGSSKLVDIFDNEKDINFSDMKNYPSYSPRGDAYIKKLVSNSLGVA
ncbi:Imm26 family immunity protein [Pseudomonas eucalypticola]|uniref:Phosphotriesterase n=1 Tax=Pseudomonas eucalypticola TaxID=2599595 RepID=A0A7D5HKS1_9PSED|nr:Imm26 family immunity protein [Pseudomonas eucalypticola]QKZ02408.1 phosphotriesterase [Pseudomonas eucalypticola]